MVLGRMVWNYSPNGRIWKITASRFGVYFVVLDIVYCLHCADSENRADRLQRLHRASLWCSICGRERHTELGGAQRYTTTAIDKDMTDMLRPPHIHDRSWDSAALYSDLLGICCTASSSHPTRPGSEPANTVQCSDAAVHCVCSHSSHHSKSRPTYLHH